MSIYLTYLLIPIVLLMFAVNIYFRFKIIKSYNRLNKQNPDLEPGLIFKKGRDEAMIREKYPKHAEDIISFSKQIRRLIYFVVIGFALILVIFLTQYFTKL